MSREKEFGQTPFAMGSLIGYRSWTVDRDGRLHPVSHRHNWMPGENVAVCDGYAHGRIEKIEGEAWADTNNRAEEWRKSHDMIDCEHGFYAYFSPNDRAQRSSPTVHGVIEGYGETLIGTKGFRCMKAKILAIAVEPWEGWVLEDATLRRLRANYPVAFFESSLAMTLEFPATNYEEVLSLG